MPQLEAPALPGPGAPASRLASLLLATRGAALLVAFGVGAGVLGVPILVARVGLPGALAVMLVGTAASMAMHLWVGRVASADPQRRQIAELILTYAIRGRNLWLTGGIFALFTLGNVGMMAGYWQGAVTVFGDAFGIAWPAPSTPGLAAFFLLAGVSLAPRGRLAGLQFLGTLLLFGALAVLVVALRPDALQSALPMRGDAGAVLPLLSVYMFCLASLFAVPQVVEALGERADLVSASIVGGQLGNMAIIAIISLVTLLISSDVPPIALMSWRTAVAPSLTALAGVFSLAALATSYWGTHHAVAKMIEDRLRWPAFACRLCVVVATFVIAFISSATFTTYLAVTGGMTALLVAFLIVPALRRVEAEGLHAEYRHTPRWLVVFVLSVYALMALGAVL